MTTSSRHDADEVHLIRTSGRFLIHHLRNRLHSGHAHSEKQLSYMVKAELHKLHLKLHGIEVKE